MARDDGWVVATPGEVEMDSLPLMELSARVDSGVYPDVHGILVVRRGRLVYERYVDGRDERLDGLPTTSTFGIDTLHDVRSVTKSVTALLLGAAIDRRMIPGVEARVLDFFPEWADLRRDGREAISLEHLLMNRSGLAGDQVQEVSAPNGSDSSPYRSVLERPMVSKPGGNFEYSGGNFTLLGGIVQRASGQPLDRFAEQVLFAPLGITSYEWMQWVDGTIRSAGGLRLRPRDLAKIGMLMLDEGRWKGQQVISSTWVRQSASRRTQDRAGAEYGYGWWIQEYPLGGREHEAIVGYGSGGQRMFAFPSLELLVVITGGAYDERLLESLRIPSLLLPEMMIQRHVLPAVQDPDDVHRPIE